MNKLVIGTTPRSPLGAELKVFGVATSAIGDALHVSRIGEAVNGAYTTVKRHIRRSTAQDFDC